MEQTAKQFIFRGHVQGVGFRYTACRIASGFAVTGYVRNLANGSVEAVIQGSPQNIDACLKKIQGAFGGHIRDIAVSPMVFNPNWKEFEVSL